MPAPISSRAANHLFVAATAVVTFTAAIVRLPFMTGRISPELQPDTIGYFEIADAISAGALFEFPGNWGYGYPTLLALLRVGGCSPWGLESCAVSLQHVIGLLFVPFLSLVGARWFGRLAALLAATLVAIAPSFFAIEDDALPDFLLAVLITTAALAIAASTDPSRRNWRYAFLAGSAVAAVVLIKPVGWVLLLSLPATLLLCGQHPRRAACLGLVAAATTLTLLSPWMIHDLIRYRSPVLSGGGGIALFHRVFEVDRQTLPERNVMEKQLAEELRAAPPEARPTFVALDALNRMGLAREAKKIMGGLARDEVRADPSGWWWRSIKLVDRYPAEIRPSDEYWTPLLTRTSSDTGATVWLWRLGVRMGDYWYLLTMAGLTSLLALVFGPAKWRRGATAGLVTGGLMAFATIASHGGQPRYSLELAPLLWLVSISGAVLLARLVLKAARQPGD